MLAEIHPRLPTLLERSAAWLGRRRSGVLALVLGAAALGAAIVALARLGADAPLFDTALKPSQAAEVEDALTLWGEPFRADSQGAQIYVAASRRRDILLRLTLAGLPRRYVPTSADVLDDQANALTPQSIIDDRRRSGIEGDLVAGLRRIGGVADATVVLPPASADPLADLARDEPPSASVQLIMQPGETLPAESVAGIRRFVASAYPGLAPDRVTVVDASGAMIGSAPTPDAAIAKERRVQSAVQSALDAVFGAGAAVVRVNVAASGAEEQTQSTRVVPHGELSADVARERGNESGKTFYKERTLRRFAYDTVSDKRVTPSDTPARMSIAVFLNAARIASTSTSDIAALVRASAGADLRAGDDVVVQTLAFAAPSPPPATSAPGDDVRPAFVSAAVACAIALFGFASLPLVRQGTAPSAPAFVERVPADLPERARVAAARDAKVASICDELEGESPQAAAYVLETLAPDIRERVLLRCAPGRRAGITAFLHDPGKRERFD